MTETPGPQPYNLVESVAEYQVPAGTNLLVAAPAPAGREFILEVLAQGLDTDEHLLVITTDDPTGTITDELQDASECAAETVTERTQVIDCQTGDLDAEASSVVEQNVDTPRNLTDIGIGFKDAFDEFEANGVERVRFGLLSLSVILSYVDRETVYRFCQTLTRGLGQEDALGLFFLNVDAHDDETVNTLSRAFDGTVQVDADTDETAVKLTGIDGISDDWITLDED